MSRNRFGTTSDHPVIDCDACPSSPGGCDGCVVSFFLGREADDALVIDVADAAEERALRLLADEGLLGHVVERRAVPPGRTGPGAPARRAV